MVHDPAVLHKIGGDPEILDIFRDFGAGWNVQLDLIVGVHILLDDAEFFQRDVKAAADQLTPLCGKERPNSGTCHRRHRQSHHRCGGDEGLAEGDSAGGFVLGLLQQLVVDGAEGIKQVVFVHR